MPLTDVLRVHARQRALKVALVQGDRQLTFRALDRTINGTCLKLASIGIGRGQLVAVALRDHWQHVIVMFALARMGAVLSPLDCRWTRTEQQSVAGHFGADHVIAEADDPLPDGWLVPDDSWFEETDAVYEDPEVTGDSPLLLSLSSGTTGMPKGPRLTHQQFENRFTIYWMEMGLTSHDVFVTATPLYFGGGRAFTVAMIMVGATLHLYPPPYEPEALVAYIAETKATGTFLVPTLLRRLLQVDFGPGLAMPTITTLVSSGSASHADERRAVRQKLTPWLYEFYSSTEGGSVSVLAPHEFEAHQDSVGRPCFRVQVEIVDAEDRPLPLGEVGRLRYRSPATPSGYYRGDSSEAFRDGWFYPGDLASLDADGFLSLRGRAKDMIIRGGVNIYPGDVESVLLSHPAVADAAVVGVPSPELGEEVAAFVVLKAPAELEDLVALCRSRLASFKVPKRITVLETLPKNSLGKVLKRELVEMAAG